MPKLHTWHSQIGNLLNILQSIVSVNWKKVSTKVYGRNSVMFSSDILDEYRHESYEDCDTKLMWDQAEDEDAQYFIANATLT